MPAKANSRKTSVPAKSKPAATEPRKVAQGDTAPQITAAGIEKHVTAGAKSEARTMQVLTLAGLLTGGTSATEPLRQMKTLIDGASPDEVKALKPEDGALALRLFKSNREAGLILLAAIAFNGLAF